MKNTSGAAPAMTSTKGDGVPSKPQGKEANAILSGGASAIANGSLNYNTSAYSKGKSGGK